MFLPDSHRRPWAAGCAMLLGIALVLHAGNALARDHSTPKASSHGHDDDDSDHGGSNAGQSWSGSGDSGSGPGSAAGSSSSGGGSNPGGGGFGGNGQRPSGGSDQGFLGINPGSGGPSFGFGFNNDGASVHAKIPISGGAHAAAHPNDHISHPILTIPFGRHEGLSRALAYGEPRDMSGGMPGGMFGGSRALTSKLIQRVTRTMSGKFIDALGHSLRTQGATAGGAGQPSPAAIVNDRFAGFGNNVFEPRIFAIPIAGETRFIPNEIVVGIPSGLPGQQVASLAQRNGLAPVDGEELPASGLTLQRWRITDRRPVADVIHALQAEADVQSAQPNFRFRLAQQAAVSETPADASSVQYAPAKLHLREAHQLSTGSNVLVAVIDTGIDRQHPEIAGAIAGSFDAIGGREPPDSHGTGIAGAIVAHGRLTGAAPGAGLLAIRAFSNSGTDAEATTMTIVRGIEWAMAHGARVINMSFAGARDPLIGRSLAAARRKGIVLVAAAGNAGPHSPPLYPAADPNVIAVSATDVDDNLLDVANRGHQIALSAPGVDLLLPAPNATYQIATGTSFAAAHVAGIAALLLASNPHLSPEMVRNILTTTARDLGPKGRDDLFGAGLADAYKAMQSVNSGGAQTVASNGPAAPAVR